MKLGTIDLTRAELMSEQERKDHNIENPTGLIVMEYWYCLCDGKNMCCPTCKKEFTIIDDEGYIQESACPCYKKKIRISVG